MSQVPNDAVQKSPAPDAPNLAASPSQHAIEPAPLPDLSRIPIWQRRYLAAIQAGLSTIDALNRANITQATISDWTTPGARRYDPVFARAESLVAQGVAVLGAIETRANSVAYVASMVDDAYDAAKPTSPHKEHDRVANRRWVGEMAGLGPQHQGADRAINISLLHTSVVVTPSTDVKGEARIIDSKAKAAKGKPQQE